MFLSVSEDSLSELIDLVRVVATEFSRHFRGKLVEQGLGPLERRAGSHPFGGVEELIRPNNESLG